MKTYSFYSIICFLRISQTLILLSMMKKISLLLLLLFSFTVSSYSQLVLVDKQQGEDVFPVVTSASKSVVCYDRSDEESVKKTVKLFVEDVERVTGKQLELKEKMPSGKDVILVGMIGKNKYINQLVAQGKLDISSIKNGWEQYVITIINNPFAGVGKALVIAGCDRRGTSYGLFSVSEAIGVSPWYWWADAPVVKKKELRLQVNTIVSKEPSVKYRGIFINDEDW